MATPIPRNSVRFSFPELREATGAEFAGPADGAVVGVTSDSRRLSSGNLFIALSGERFDGHGFVNEAVERGARALLVERPVEVPSNVTVLRVPSTLSALGALARFHRRRMECRVIAVAGSAGKTTTKTVVASALELIAPGRVHVSAGNLNNAIGVPFVLLALTPEHRYAVVEIGTNRPGEVRELTQLSEPDIGILTLIGLEHSEGLGGLDAIEEEEAAVLAGVAETGSIVFNRDDARVCRRALRANARRKVGYGRDPAAEYRLLERSQATLHGSRLVVGRPDHTQIIVHTALLGEAGAQAVLAALATAELCRGAALDAQAFSARLTAELVGAPGRLSVVELADGSVVVDDSYNSNPASASSSLSVARELAGHAHRRLLVVMGEMLELGSLSLSEHRRLGSEIAATRAAYLLAIGGDARQLVEPVRAAGIAAAFVEDSEEALPLLLRELQRGDVVLVKASRGVQAERVVRGLVEAKGRAR